MQTLVDVQRWQCELLLFAGVPCRPLEVKETTVDLAFDTDEAYQKAVRILNRNKE